MCAEGDGYDSLGHIDYHTLAGNLPLTGYTVYLFLPPWYHVPYAKMGWGLGVANWGSIGRTGSDATPTRG